MRMARGQQAVKRIGHPQRPQFMAPPTEQQEVEILLLTNMVLIHVHAAIVHKLGSAHENTLNDFMHIKCCSVIDAIPLSDSPAFLTLGIIACNHEPISPSKFCGSTGEATATIPA